MAWIIIAMKWIKSNLWVVLAGIVAAFIFAYSVSIKKNKSYKTILDDLLASTRTTEATVEKEQQNRDDARDAQKEISETVLKTKKPKKTGSGWTFGKWLIIFTILFGSACTPQIVKEYVYIKPELPMLYVVERPVLHEIDIQQNDEGSYLLSASQLDMLWENEQTLISWIKLYERQIEIYNNFYNKYYEKAEENE